MKFIKVQRLYIRGAAMMAALTGAWCHFALATEADESDVSSEELLIMAEAFDVEASSDGELGSPEYEFKKALNDLENIQRSLIATQRLAGSQSLGSREVAGDRAYHAAKRYFRANEPLSVIRELNTYLNLSQIPNIPKYLESLYMLGYSYQNIGMEQRAVRAYRRYLSAYLGSSSRNDEEALKVLKQMLPLAVKSTNHTSQELDKLLAAVASMSERNESEVLYLAAQAASQGGRTKVAADWFKAAAENAGDPSVKARAKYYQALMSLSEKDFESTERYLTDVLAIDGIDPDMQHLTHLALARVNIHLRKPQAAIAHYRQVASESPSYRDALFELTYVYLDTNEDSAAKATAAELIQRYPKSSEALNLRMILSYIDMRNGDLEGAELAMQAARADLARIDRWLLDNLHNRKTVPFALVNELVTTTALELNRSPLTTISQQLFQRIVETQRNLADLRGELRDTLYTIGRAHVIHYQPSWENRVSQLDELTRQLLLVGHKMTATEMVLHEKRLGRVDEQRLKASMQRRHHLFSQNALFRRQVDMWSSWINITSLSEDVIKALNTTQKRHAELSGLAYLGHANDKHSEDDLKAIELLSHRQHQIQLNLKRSLELIRKKQVLNLSQRSHHSVVKSGFIQFANALHDEASVLQRYRDQPTDPSLRAISIDARRAWDKWEYVAKLAYDALSSFHSEMVADLKNTIDSIQLLIDRHDDLVEQTDELNAALESHLGESVLTFVNHYRSEISKRLALQQKWQADIEWLKFSQRGQGADHELESIKLQQQILRDNLDDMIQGASREWQ